MLLTRALHPILARPQERFFDHEPHPLGSARGSCQDEFLMPRLLAAGRAALQRWAAAGGEGADAVTHLIVGGLTSPRASPGAYAFERCCAARLHARETDVAPSSLQGRMCC